MPLPFALPPVDPGFELLVSSQGMSQGIAQTDGIQLFPRISVRMGAVQIGVQWKNIDAPVANGVAAVFARYGRTVGKTQFDAGVRYRIRTGREGPGDAAAWEFSGAVRRSLGKAALQASAEYSPDEFGSGRSLYVELGPVLKVNEQARISGGVGWRYRQKAPDYVSFNSGISRSVGRGATLDARLYATTRSELGARYRPRAIVSARLTF